MWLEREYFEKLMLADQITFNNYAGLFMDLEVTPVKGFLDWCWEKYLEGGRTSPVPSDYDDGNSGVSGERTLYARI